MSRKRISRLSDADKERLRAAKRKFDTQQKFSKYYEQTDNLGPGELRLTQTQEDIHAKTRAPRRSVFDLHWSLILSSAFFALAWDFSNIIMHFLTVERGVPTGVWGLIIGCLFMIQIPLQTSIAVYLLAKAVKFRGPLNLYVSSLIIFWQTARRLHRESPNEPAQTSRRLHRESPNDPAQIESLVRVGRLVFWLALSAACMLLTSISGVVLIWSYVQSSQVKKI